MAFFMAFFKSDSLFDNIIQYRIAYFKSKKNKIKLISRQHALAVVLELNVNGIPLSPERVVLFRLKYILS